MANFFERFSPTEAATEPSSGSPENIFSKFRQTSVPDGAPGGVRDFVSMYGGAAAEAGAQLGVDPKLLLAQWGLETGWGRSVIPGTNNLGNIKAFGDWKGPSVRAHDKAEGSNDPYRVYNSPIEFADDYARFMENPRYSGALGVGGDAERFADGLVRGGYATDPNYRGKILSAVNMLEGAYIAPAGGRQGVEQRSVLHPDDDPLSPKKLKGKDRSWFATINDTVIDTANAAVGLVKAGSDFVRPGNFVSQALDEFIKSGQESQSDWRKASRDRLQTQLAKADGEVDKIGIWLKHSILEDPLSLVGEAVGNIGVFGALGKGLRLAGASQAAVSSVMAPLSAALATGEVRGNIYDEIQRMSDSDLQERNPEYQRMRQTMSESAAKDAWGSRLVDHLPELAMAAATGAIAGRIGLEGMAAGVGRTAPGIVGRGAAALAAGATEGIQGAGEQLATNIGVMRSRPEQGLWENVGLNAVMEGAIGGIGGAVSPLAARAKREEDKTREIIDQVAGAETVDDAIRAAARATESADAGAPFYDTLEGRVKFAQAAADRETMRAMRADERFGPQSVAEMLDALAIARNPNLDDTIRSQAIDGLERLLTAWNERPNFTTSPGDGGSGGLPATVSTGPQMRTPPGQIGSGTTIEGDVTEYGGALLGRAAPRIEDQRPLQGAAEEDRSGAVQRAAERSDEMKARALAEPADRVEAAAAEAAARTATDQAKAATMADVDARVQGAMAQEAAGRRDEILARVMSEEGVSNPVRRFEAELRRAGIKADKATSREVERLNRAVEARDALSQDERIPAAPNEMPEGLVPERRETLPTGRISARPGRVDGPAHEAAASPANDLPQPTVPQQKAGNYKKGKFRLAGFNISIENPADSTRSGVDEAGRKWSSTMKGVHYGYVTGVPRGKDGDHIDIFVKQGLPLSWKGNFYVIDQNKANGQFDEHKIVAGARNAEEALRIYRAQYGKGAARPGGVSSMTAEQLQDWFDRGDTTKRATQWRRENGQGAVRKVEDAAVQEGRSVSQAESAPRQAAAPGEESVGSAGQNRARVRPTVEQVSAWVGPRRGVRIVQSVSDIPESVSRRLKGVGPDAALEGLYDKSTGEVWLVADHLRSRARALWVAAHEGGHRGFDALNRATNGEAMRKAQGLRANATVQALSEAVAADRGIAVGRVSMEEALVELIAANETGDFAHLADRYGVSAENLRTPRTLIGRFMDWLRGWFKSNGATDAEVRTLLREIAAENRPVRSGASSDVVKAVSGAGPSQEAAASVAPRRNVTNTPEFKRWFGDSKVVDENGEPLVVYHGTNSEFDVFDQEKAAHDIGGVWLTDTEGYADWISRRGDMRRPAGNVMPLYLKMENPKVFDIIEEAAKEAENIGIDAPTDPMEAQRLLSGGMGWNTVVADIAHDAKLAGHDGLIIKRFDDGFGFETTAYVAFNPEQIKSATGNSGAFDSENPSVLASVAKTPDWAKGNANLESATSKVETYAPEKTIREKWREMTAQWKERLVQGVFDQFAPLKRLDPSAYVLARMTKSADGVLEGLLNYGVPKMDADGAIYGDLDMKGFLGAMQELNGEHDRFMLWVAGNRAGRLMLEGREHLFTPDEILAMKGLNTGQMKDGRARAHEYAKALAALNKYSTAVLDIAEQTGLIDGDSRKIWEHDFYVPFYRQMEDGEISGAGKVKGLVRQQAFQKLKGGEESLGDLMANTLRNWSHLISASLSNQAAGASLRAAEAAGIALTAPADTARQMAKRTSGKGSATYFMDQGVEHWYVVDDPMVLDAITAIESASFKGLPMKVLGKAKHYLTMGTTISPSFRIRNLIRDSLSAIGQNDMSYNVMANVAQGWNLTDRKSPDYAQMLFGGALMRFGTNYEGDRGANIKRLIEAGIDDKTVLDTPGKVKAGIAAVWNAWQNFGDRMENVNRTALYKQLRDQGMSHLEAAFQARDMIDFSLQGSFVAVRFLTQMVPFMNARAQGLYKLGRAAKDDPKRMAYVTSAVALASIGLLLAFKDDDDWKAREDWDRDAYWWFKVGDTAFRIPKPFEIGALGTIAERSVEFAISDEMTGKRFAERMKTMVKDTFAMNPVPQLFKPALDLYANVDSFTGRQIETRGMERLSKSERSNFNTSWIANVLGAAGDTTGISPVQVDHLIRAYFGWLGSHIAMGVDLIADPIVGKERPARRIDDYLTVGDFVKELPSNRSRYLEEFRKQAKEVSEIMADIRHHREVGEIEQAQEIAEKNRDKVMLHNTYQAAERKMQEIGKELRLVQARAGLDPETKRLRIDELSKAQNDLARTVRSRAMATVQ